MIRQVYIQNQILTIYRKLSVIQYPIQPETLAAYLPIRTKLMSYRQLSIESGCSIQDVVDLCGSVDGATHYVPNKNRCVILYNESSNPGRILWTKLHEIGHICLGHIEVLPVIQKSANYDDETYRTLENEANYFTWNTAAPLPIMRELNVQSVPDTIEIFGLSEQAAVLQFERYQRWQKNHIKTAWENDILREFRCKGAAIRRQE